MDVERDDLKTVITFESGGRPRGRFSRPSPQEWRFFAVESHDLKTVITVESGGRPPGRFSRPSPQEWRLGLTA